MSEQVLRVLQSQITNVWQPRRAGLFAEKFGEVAATHAETCRDLLQRFNFVKALLYFLNVSRNARLSEQVFTNAWRFGQRREYSG